MEPIRVLIADDHKIIIDGIKSLLMDEPGIKVVEEVGNGEKVLTALNMFEIDVVLMDITMPNLNGIETTKIVKEKHPNVSVLALTMHDEDQYFKKMLEAGASGYVLKHTGQDELVKAIRTVNDGQNFFSQEVSTRLIMNKLKADNEPKDEMVALTKREIEILRLIAEEMKNHEIADELFISIRTVDTHRRNLLQKLNVKNTAGLVRYAVKNGIVD